MKTIVIGVIILIGVFAWSPWLTKEYAEQKAVRAFTSSWTGVTDGCGFDCKNCGVKGSRQAFFGRFVDIEYGCGMKVSSDGENRKSSIFVFSFGPVFGDSLGKTF